MGCQHALKTAVLRCPYALGDFDGSRSVELLAGEQEERRGCLHAMVRQKVLHAVCAAGKTDRFHVHASKSAGNHFESFQRRPAGIHSEEWPSLVRLKDGTATQLDSENVATALCYW